ncbi:hypothetical protein FRC05_011623 [Tulasnella sp. 425]|nr:hypothetical protein FRC05_011623 [Tulasnella sp. 425]
MDQVAGGPQKAMRQSYYTWTGHADPDDEPRSSVAAAHKYVKRSRDLESRMDEDEDDLDLLKPDPNLVKRQELQEGFDEDDEDYFDDLPDHPPKIK